MYEFPDIITNLSSMLEKSCHSFSILKLCKQSFMNKFLPKRITKFFCLELKLRLFDGWCFLQLMPEEITQSVTSSRHVIGKQEEIATCSGFHLRLTRLKLNAEKISEK